MWAIAANYPSMASPSAYLAPLWLIKTPKSAISSRVVVQTQKPLPSRVRTKEVSSLRCPFKFLFQQRTLCSATNVLRNIGNIKPFRERKGEIVTAVPLPGQHQRLCLREYPRPSSARNSRRRQDRQRRIPIDNSRWIGNNGQPRRNTPLPFTGR